jgi:thermopsin
MFVLSLLSPIIRVSSAQLVTPLSIFNSSIPMPVGIASYGLYNVSNATGPYKIETNEIIGFARIDSINAYNSSPPANTSAYGATVQLNVVMNVTSVSGNRYSYWIQDVMDVNTSNRTYVIGDNVWNFTGVISNVTNETLSGEGNVTPPSSNDPFSLNFTAGFYSAGFNTTYNLNPPTYFLPVIEVSDPGQHPLARIGYIDNNRYVFYDNVTFNITAASAYLLVTPYYLTPVRNASSNATGNYYDAEMVLGGEGSGAIASFNNTNATLWIGYNNGSAIVPFPSVGTFGVDTEEAAVNLTTSQSGGNVAVKNGPLNYGQTLYLSGVPAFLQQATTPAQPTTTVATNYTTTQATTILPSASQNQSNASTSVGSPTPPSGTGGSDSAIVAAVAVMGVAIIYLIIRSMRRSAKG